MMGRSSGPIQMTAGRYPRAVAAGVCAVGSDLTGIPVALLRVGLVFGLVEWCWPVAVAYIVTAVALRTRLRRMLPAAVLVQAALPPSPPGSPLAFFSELERRLARVEAAAMSDELRLRMRFRELER